MLYIAIIILILFLMYVYKKKCDEDYYLSIIQSTQQQYMFKNFQNQNYSQYQGPQPYTNIYSGNPYNNNYYNPYKTPENQNTAKLYSNNYYNYNNNNLNNIHPTPIRNKNENIYGYHNNGNRSHIMEDQIVYNKLNNINNINDRNNNQNKNFQKYNNNVNKKVFKLEDFLSGTKKNNLNDKFNLAANDGF